MPETRLERQLPSGTHHEAKIAIFHPWALLCSHGLSKVGPKIATIGFGFWQAQKVDKGLLLKFGRFDTFSGQIDPGDFRQVETYHFAT